MSKETGTIENQPPTEKTVTPPKVKTATPPKVKTVTAPKVKQGVTPKKGEEALFIIKMTGVSTFCKSTGKDITERTTQTMGAKAWGQFQSNSENLGYKCEVLYDPTKK